jgi:hypothetical protein
VPVVYAVADAGMIFDDNQQAIEDAKLSFILGTRIPDVPYVVKRWRDKHPGKDIPDGHVFTQACLPPKRRRPRAAETRSSTTSPRPIGRGERCAGSTNRSPRPRAPSPRRWR